MKKIIILTLFAFSSIFAFTQTQEKGMVYKQTYWVDGSHYNSEGDYDKVNASVKIFLTDKNIYLTRGTSKKTFKIQSSKIIGTQAWEYSCSTSDGKTYSVEYLISTLSGTAYNFFFTGKGTNKEKIIVEYITEIERID